MPAFGEIVLAAGGTYSSKPRPVLVFQNQSFYTGESILVIPFTTLNNPNIKTRLSIVPTEQNGLNKLCYLEIDKLSAVNSACISSSLGRLEEVDLVKAKTIISKLLMIKSEE